MRKMLGIVMTMLALVAYAGEPQDSVIVVQDTLQVLVEDSAGVMMLTDTIVEVVQSIVVEDTVEKKGNILTGKYERLKDGTRIYSDSVIYQGMNLKLDIATTILEAAISKGSILSFEAAWNIRLKQRFYPTLEGGYVNAKASADGGIQDSEGGFFRVGLDINGLKKHPERLNGGYTYRNRLDKL